MWLQTGAYHLGALPWLIAVIVIFIIAIVALAVACSAARRAKAARQARGTYSSGGSGTGSEASNVPEAFRMLDERYAKGEISREEYMQRQTDLQSRA